MRIPGQQVERARLIQTEKYVVAVEVEMVISTFRHARRLRPVNPQVSSSGVMHSQSSFSCNQMGSAFLAMNSSTARPSIN